MAITVKLQDMGVKVTKMNYDAAPVGAGKKKKIIEHPTVELNSKNLPGLEKLTLDSRCRFYFEADVVSLSEASKYDKERMGLSEGDVTGRFKLIKGEIMPLGDSANYVQASAKVNKG